ncbi:hypothetical protein N0V86_007437 [Didymella sp. IMI 355093]|nr:hypothetical protein N0V86_007437 [Didymella sp. IMI 355093]
MTDNKSWTCGFCHEILPNWDARATHIATHFKAGLTMVHWRERRVSQSTQPQEHIQPQESSDLDEFGVMDTTFAGPSDYRLAATSHARIDSAQHQQLQPTSTSAFMSTPTTVPDINIDPFCMYGNPIDTFDQSLSYNPSAPVSAQNVDTMPADFGLVGIDDYGNPVYDFLFRTW